MGAGSPCRSARSQAALAGMGHREEPRDSGLRFHESSYVLFPPLPTAFRKRSRPWLRLSRGSHGRQGTELRLLGPGSHPRANAAQGRDHDELRQPRRRRPLDLLDDIPVGAGRQLARTIRPGSPSPSDDRQDSWGVGICTAEQARRSRQTSGRVERAAYRTSAAVLPDRHRIRRQRPRPDGDAEGDGSRHDPGTRLVYLCPDGIAIQSSRLRAGTGP